MDYHQLMRRRIEGEETGVPWWLDTKHGVRQFAMAIGVRVAERFAAGELAELLSRDLPPRFVLKPAFASTAIGVRLLERRMGLYFDLVSHQMLSSDELVEEGREIAYRFLGDDSSIDYVAEELLEGTDGTYPPPDIRCFAFQGVLGLIVMEHRIPSPVRAAYFDGEFNRIDNIDQRYSVHPNVAHLETIVELPRPDEYLSLLNVAARVSIAAPTPFCRVDLYNTRNGVVLGEITLKPGTFYFRDRKLMSESESRRFGSLWADAAKRLEGSSTVSGSLTSS